MRKRASFSVIRDIQRILRVFLSNFSLILISISLCLSLFFLFHVRLPVNFSEALFFLELETVEIKKLIENLCVHSPFLLRS